MPDPITIAFEAAFRQFETDGLPSTAKHKPAKADLRGLGAVISAEIETRAGKEEVAPTARGLSSGAAGGTAYFDPLNILGGGRGVYLPRTYRRQRVGGAAQESTGIGVVSTTAGFTDFTFVATPTTTTPLMVWHVFGLTTPVYGANTVLPPADPNLDVIGTVNGNRFHAPNFDVVTISDTPQLSQRSEIVIEASATPGVGADVSIPRFFGYHPLCGTIDLAGTGALYKKITNFGGGSGSYLYFSFLKYRQGLDPFEVYTFQSCPKETHYLVLRGSQNKYASPFTIVGDVVGGAIPNQLAIGKNNPSAADVIFANTTPKNFTDALLIARGFTIGMENLVTGAPYYGGSIPYNDSGGHASNLLVVETDVDETVIAPPVPVQFLWKDNGAGGVSTIQSRPMTLFEVVSPRARIYYHEQKYGGADKPIKMGAGVAKVAGVNTIIGGLQINYGLSRGRIMSNHYPTASSGGGVVDPVALGKTILNVPDYAPEPIFGDGLDLVEDRPLTLDARALFGRPQSGDGVVVTVGSTKASRGNFTKIRTGPVITLDGREIDDELLLDVRKTMPDAGDAYDLHWSKTIAVRVARAARLIGRKPRLLFGPGNSTPAMSGLATALALKLGSLGIDAEFLGTVDMGDYLSGLTVKGEARAGMTSGSFTGFETNPASVLYPIGSTQCPTIADYFAMTNEQRKAINPFLWPAASGTPAAWQVGGKVYSVKQYCDQTDQPYPDFVFQDVGINNTIRNASNIALAASDVTRDTTIYAGTLLTELPNCHPLSVGSPVAFSTAGNGVFERRQIVNLAIQKAVRASANPKSYFISCHVLGSREIDYYAVGQPGTTNAETGVVTSPSPKPDSTHMVGRNSESMAEAFLGRIATVISSVKATEDAFERMGAAQPRNTFKNAIRRGVEELEDIGTLAKVGGLWAFGLPAETQALINLIAATDATKIGAPIFTLLKGHTFGSGAALASGFNPGGSPAGLMTRDSHHLGVFLAAESAGWVIGNSQIAIAPCDATGKTSLRSASTTTDDLLNTLKGSTGHSVLSRGLSTEFKFWHDAVATSVATATVTRASAALISEAIRIGHANGLPDTETAGPVFGCHLGSDLGVADIAAIGRFFKALYYPSGSIPMTVMRPLYMGATPAEGATGVARNPTFQVTPLDVRYAWQKPTHWSTNWEVRRQSDNSLVWSSVNDKVNLTTIALAANALPAASGLYLQVEHRTGARLLSARSFKRNFTTA